MFGPFAFRGQTHKLQPLTGVTPRWAFLTVLCFILVHLQALASDLQQAVQQLDNKEFSKAIETLEQIVETSPQNAQAFYLLGVAFTGTGDLDRSDSSFRQALQHNPNLYFSLRGLAINAISRGQLDSAQRHFTDFLNWVPEDEMAHAFMGRISLTQNEFSKAVEHFDQATSFLDQQPLVKVSLAEALAREGSHERALVVVESLPLEDANVAYRAGLVLVELGSWKRAASLLEHVLLELPGLTPARYQLALCHENLDQPRQAKELLGKIIADHQADLDIWLHFIYIQASLGEFDSAKESLQQALQTLPLSGIPREEFQHAVLGRIELMGENFDLAIDHFKKADSFLKERPHFKLSLAEALAARGSREESIALLDSLGSNDPELTFPSAMVFVSLDEWERAADLLQKVLSERPNWYDARYQLAFCFAGMNRLPEATQLLRQIVDEGQADSNARLLLANLQASKGSVNEAISTLNQSVRLHPRCEDCYVVLAELQMGASEFPDAVKTVAAGLGQHPDSGKLIEQRAQLAFLAGRYLDAESDFRKLLQSDPDHRDTLLSGLIFAMLKSGQSEAAIRELRERIQSGTDNFYTYYLLGMSLIRKGAPPAPEVSQILEKVVELHSQYTDERLEKARVALQKNAPQNALDHLMKAIDVDPQNPAAFQLLSTVFQKLEDPDKAQMMKDKAQRFRRLREEDRAEAERQRVKHIRRAIRRLWRGLHPL